MKPKSPKEDSISKLNLILSILSVIIIFGGSSLIYYFSKGYRINILEQQIRRTGVLTVQTEPNIAQLYINNEPSGRTPRSRSLETGIHSISVWKQGYREWRKEIEILEGRATPIFPFLILEENTETTLWESTQPVAKNWTNKYRSHFIFLQQNSENDFTLWTYRINTPIWNLTPNPTQVLSTENDQFELNISPNGQLAILQQDNTNYLIELTKTNTLTTTNTIAIESETDYKIHWSNDNRHLIVENETEIKSIDTNNKQTYNILTKENNNEPIIWTTDEEGFLYTIKQLEDDDQNIHTYQIEQTKLDGTTTTYIIEKAYFQQDSSFIEHYRNNGEIYPEFKNSPQSTQSTGAITEIIVNQKANGVYIKTTSATYWYNIKTDRYRMISPYPAELIEISPDSKSLLFVNGEKIYKFTFDKEDGDHTKILGSKRIENILKENTQQITWLSNSSYIAYIKESYIHISEDDGENAQQIIPTENILIYSIKSARDYITTLEQEEVGTSIKQYRLK